MFSSVRSSVVNIIFQKKDEPILIHGARASNDQLQRPGGQSSAHRKSKLHFWRPGRGGGIILDPWVE